MSLAKKRKGWAALGVRLLVAVLIVCAGGTKVLEAQTKYKVWDLGSLPGTANNSSAWGINAAGQVVGGSGSGGSDDRAFRWTPSVPCPALPTPPLPALVALQPLSGYAASGGNAINAAGDVVGASKQGERATLWRANGTPVDLGGTMSWATGINNRGEISGYNNASYEDPVYWRPTLVMEALPLLPGGYAGHPRCINEADVNGRGQMVGFSEGAFERQRACIWSWSGTAWSVQGLPFLAGGIERSYGEGINDSGKAVGVAYTASSRRATLWDSLGAHDLGDLPGGSSDSYAYNLNNLGQVVGWGSASSGTHAFVWDSVAGMQDLNNLLDSSGIGWTLQSANDINDSGWIVGVGINQNGNRHAVLLTPEPATLSLLALGGLAVMRRRRR